jgi:hypothetical protein
MFRRFDKPVHRPRIPVERIESRNICTSGKRRPVAPKGYAGRMICVRSPQGSIALDHLAGTAIADPDASRSSAERDIGGPARHVLPDPYSWFGSAGRPRVVFVAELLEHNLRCNKLGRDRNPGRSTPASGTGYTKRTGQSGLRIRVREDVHWACRNAGVTSLAICAAGGASATHGDLAVTSKRPSRINARLRGHRTTRPCSSA